MDMLELVREQVRHCEALGVEILCCPEGVIGGLADYCAHPREIAMSVDDGQLSNVLAPLASDTVATIVGFTEADRAGRLYNAAAVLNRGSVVGIYRKLNPAINRSVYAAGREAPVFTVGALTFGIIICRDSAFPEPAGIMVSRGAAALFVPTNNGLPPDRASPEIVAEARRCDVAHAMRHRVPVIRADVAGRTPDLVSYGSSGVVSRDGTVLGTARQLEPGLVVADIEPTQPPVAS